jgi:hypothetical protein
MVAGMMPSMLARHPLEPLDADEAWPGWRRED